MARQHGSSGSRQLLRALRASEPGEATDSPLSAVNSILAERLLLLVGWGLVSPNCARWLAEGAVLDGSPHDQIQKLSGIGTNCKYPNLPHDGDSSPDKGTNPCQSQKDCIVFFVDNRIFV